MAELHMVENSRGRAKNFWAGFVVGVLFMTVAVIIFWFLGVIDVFPQAQTNRTNETESQNETTNNDDNELAPDSQENDVILIDESDNDTNNTDNTTQESDESGSSSSTATEGVTLTTARNVDSSAHAVDPTEIFSSEDERIYVVVELDDPAELGESPTITVEWYKDGSRLSDFDYDLPEGQSRVYFYQTNQGDGDYEVAILVNEVELARSEFVVE